MSFLNAKVIKIESCDSLHIVKFECNSEVLTMMSLELDEKIKEGSRVGLVVKPSHIAIAKEFSGSVSYSNILKATITSVNNGELLSSVKLDYHGAILESIITLASSKRLDLRDGDEVSLFIKASEISISEVLDA
ncbi:MAG: TOBE domain-containing protein [Campylobacterales bacterium]|nr:TOBE domain-containing protein [Campylobacterales bacterium]